jgi:N-acetylglutamate synthase-like GNAT family acetyltransferase
MDTIQIRAAQESESTPIRDLIHLVGINPTGLDWKRFIVAVNAEGQVIACGQIKPHGADIQEMASIATHPDHRGKGLARKIIDALLKESARPMYLMCIAHNGPMYEKFGFKALDYKDMPRYFQRIQKVFNLADVFRRTGEELLVMKLE